MSLKKNNKILLIVFGILLVLFGVSQIGKLTKGERTFRKDIIEFEGSEISAIVFNTKGASSQTVELFREDTLWKLKAGNKFFAADQELAKGIADELAFITPDRLVANKKDLWKEYDVTDSAGVKVSVVGPKKSKVGLVIGRFSYNQSTRKPSTFLRMEGEKEVYAVEGYLSMTLNGDLNNLRDKNLYRGNRNDITRLTFTYPGDSSFVLTREGTRWLCDGVPTDSTLMVRYLNEITYLTANDFRDDFQSSAMGTGLYKLKIEGVNIPMTDLTVYEDPSGQVIGSSANPSTWFAADKENFIQRVFKGKTFFVPKS